MYVRCGLRVCGCVWMCSCGAGGLQAIAAFQDNMARRLEQDWKAEKKHILQLLSTQPAALPQRHVVVSDAAQQVGVLGGLAAVYASAVKKLVSQGEPARQACHVFHDKISNSDAQDPMLRTCWKYLRFVEDIKNAQGGQACNMAQLAQEFLQTDYRDVQFGGRNVLSDLEAKSHSMAWQHIDEPDRQWAVIYFCLRAGFGVASSSTATASRADQDRRELLAYVRQKQATFGPAFIDQLDAYLRGEPCVAPGLARVNDIVQTCLMLFAGGARTAVWRAAVGTGATATGG